MKKKLRILSAGALVIVMMVSTAYAFASDELIGAANVTNEGNYTIEEMLKYAIEDEYMAKAEYEAIIKDLQIQRPFSNIVRAEDMHIRLLVPLFEKYELDLPENQWSENIVIPSTISEAYKTGRVAEEKNIDMYSQFLTQELPSDVEYVFKALVAGSKKHLATFERGETRLENQYISGNGNEKRGTGNGFRNAGKGVGNGGEPLCI